MLKPIEVKKCWLIQNKKTGNIVLTYRTESGNTKKAFFGEKEQAMEILERRIPKSKNYRICGVKKGNENE